MAQGPRGASARRRRPRSCVASDERESEKGDPRPLIEHPMFATAAWAAASNSSVRKEVIQPQVPLRLPCYDLVPVTELAFGAVLPKVRQSDFERSPLPWLDGRCVQGSGTYSPRHG